MTAVGKADSDARRPLTKRLAGVVSVDLAWYGISALLAVGGLLLQLFSTGAREKGIGVLVVVLGLFAGLTRLLLQRTTEIRTTLSTRLGELTRTLRIVPASLAEDAGLSPIAVKLWTEAVERHHNTFATLSEGAVHIAGGARTVQSLRLLTEEAMHTLHAVDQVEPMRWLDDPDMNDYLRFQLARVQAGEVSLERIRIVTSGHLESAEARAALTRLVELHEASGAVMLLCPEDGARRLETDFFPPKGALIIDRDAQPACLTGRIERDGYIANAIMYLRLTGPARATMDDYDQIAARIARDDWDMAMRTQLGLNRGARTASATPVDEPSG